MLVRTGPRDTFVLFAAAHGTSVNGHFYLIPQDYQGGLNPEALVRSAISQTQLQDWLARFKVKRAIILLDTCESGAVIEGYLRSRTSGAASEARDDRQNPERLLSRGPLLDGLISDAGQRHGVLTYALLDSLRKGDTNGDGVISLSELVGHVQGLVPKLSAKFGGGAPQLPRRNRLRAGKRHGLAQGGEDFTLARRPPN
jgi:uncharacterized caspase-like protein